MLEFLSGVDWPLVTDVGLATTCLASLFRIDKLSRRLADAEEAIVNLIKGYREYRA